MHVPTLIEHKRDGGTLTSPEIEALIRGFLTGEVPDYQMSALAMAIFFRGMTAEETAALTLAMMNSGRVLQYPSDAPPVVDKHSTGGVGDKVSLVLAPLLACDELWVPMISGRGLGITGGTLDKLESIPGFNAHLSEEAALLQLERIGVFMIGQTEFICPADKKLYALRDVTGTVPSRALIIASIMSKKLAENLDALVLDVKFGSGAFMKTREDAESLAEGLVTIGEKMEVRISSLLSPMNQPLGRTVGNALEVYEAVQTLRGEGPDDITDLVLSLAERVSQTDRGKLKSWLENGAAWEKFVAIVEAQGGDASALERIDRIHAAPLIETVNAPLSGRIRKMDAGTFGRSCTQLGGGRSKTTDTIDFSVGFSEIRKLGDEVNRGEPLFRIHARTRSSLESVRSLLKSAIEIDSEHGRAGGI
jgi:pyrimidine-nucleoside phosphorylase